MCSFELRTFAQRDRNTSPWPLSVRIRYLSWLCSRALVFATTPKALNPWRLLVLRVFGATISGRPFVSPSARIRMPWNLQLEDGACIGEEADIYNLARVSLMQKATVAQQCYLCTGTHDLADERRPLMVAEIRIGRDAFVGARAFVLPGVDVGDRAIVGAGSVVTNDVPVGAVVAGNPARPLRQSESGITA